MRPDPPSRPSRPGRRDRAASEPLHSLAGPRRRCPYLEQILKERAGPFGLLTRFKADCHVDRRTHRFTGRHPSPPCITEPETCGLYGSERDNENATIHRYTD